MDRDVGWLQRDLGLHLVNVFDTGRAARALGMPSLSLAYLLRVYAEFEADKRHQLADWRRRPAHEDRLAAGKPMEVSGRGNAKGKGKGGAGEGRDTHEGGETIGLSAALARYA